LRGIEYRRSKFSDVLSDTGKRVRVDPDFDPGRRAFYYVRVIEIPTPRWTAYDAKFFSIKMPEGTKMQVQDRAYTSPIWYTP